MNIKRLIFTFIFILLSSNSLFCVQNRTILDIKIKGLVNLKPEAMPSLSDFNSKVGLDLETSVLETDVKSLYLSGYFSEVSSNVVQLRDGVILELCVKENSLIKNIIFRNHSLYSTQQLKSYLNSRENQVFNTKFLDQDIQSIENFYHNGGYDLFQVEQVVFENGDLIFSLEEGLIRDVRFSGVEKTKMSVILRELRQKEGVVFNSNLLRLDRARILKTGYFSDVPMPKISAGVSQNATISYRLTEKKINFLNVGVEQLEQDQGVAIFAKLLHNHSVFYSDSISVKTQFLLSKNIELRSYSLRYYQPWFLNRIPISFATDLWTEFRQESFAGETNLYLNSRRGADIIFGLPLLDDTVKISTKGRYETISPRDGETFSSYSIRSLGLGVSYDTRLNTVNPSQGQYAIYSYERGGNFGALQLGGLNFTRWSLRVANFFPISNQDVFAVNAFYGSFDKQETSIKTFESEGFWVGGSNSLRGYKELAFTGNRRISFNAEYRHLLLESLQGVLFYDVGQVFTDDNAVSLDLRNYYKGYGFGFRYFTALAPFRLDFGFGHDEMIIHFNLGQAF